jgi:hypothetical protein
VCIHLQANTAVSWNANASIRFIIFTHKYTWFKVIPHYMRCCYRKQNNQTEKWKKNKNNYDSRTNYPWGPLVSIQMQCLFLLNKRKIKSLQIKKYIFL